MKGDSTLTYEWDWANRLIETDDGSQVIDFTYDESGNRLNHKINLIGQSEVEHAYSYNVINAIISETIDGGTPQSFTYDDAGHLTDDGTLAYTWDRADRLLSTNDGVTTVNYEYNGLGQRVKQDTTEYLLDTVQGLPRVIADKTGSSINRYVFSDHGLLRHQKPDSSWVHPLQDGLGSVRHIVDASLDPLYSVNHAPYGELWNAQGTSPMPFGFTEQWQDPNNLLFLRTRYYNPAQAAFLSLDPLEGGLNNVGALNRYGYVTANPVNFVDPSGKSAWASVPTCPQGAPTFYFSGLRVKLGCRFNYNLQLALGHALGPSCDPSGPDHRDQPELGDPQPLPGGGYSYSYCAMLVTRALVTGGMPRFQQVDDPNVFSDPGIANLGFCPYDTDNSKRCSNNWRDAHFLTYHYLKRRTGNAYGSSENYTSGADVSHEGSFIPGVEIIEPENIRVGDIIFQSENDGAPIGHVAFFIGWGPNPNVSNASDAVERLNNDTGANWQFGSGTIPSWLTPTKTDDGHVMWVVDDINPGTSSGPRPFIFRAYSARISQVLRIPPSFAVNLDYVRKVS